MFLREVLIVLFSLLVTYFFFIHGSCSHVLEGMLVLHALSHVNMLCSDTESIFMFVTFLYFSGC